MRTAFLITDAFEAIGGIETFNRAFTKALDDLAAKHGWEAEVLSLLDHEPERTGAAYIKSGKTSLRGFGGNKIKFSAAAIAASWKADVTILGHVNLAPLACVMNSSRKFLVVHGIDVWKRLPVLQRLGVGRVDRILSVSNYTRQEMMKYNGVPQELFGIFPNTLDPLSGTSDILYSREELGLPSGLMILCVSRLAASEPYKNIDLLLEAMPKIIQSIPQVLLVIVGDGSDRKRLEALATKLGIDQHVFFKGRVQQEKLSSYYSSCDVFALPSTGEGFGICFLEAMKYGKACVGADSAAIPEVIEHGNTGDLISTESVECLSASIVRYLRSPEYRNNSGVLGKKRFEEQFTFEVYKERLELALEAN